MTAWLRSARSITVSWKGHREALTRDNECSDSIVRRYLRDKQVAWVRDGVPFHVWRHLFAELIRQTYKERGKKPPASYDWLEMKMKSNFPTTVKTWTQQALAQGLAEGMAKGRAEGEARGRIEGKAEGKAEALVHLLVARFGALAPSLRTRIQRAKLPTLERWFKRAIAASDLRSVFNSPR